MAPSPVTGWRFVERDLYDIARRVREYDSEARLIREDGTGQLGLARWQKSNVMGTPGYWAFARNLHDLDTDLPLRGEPDARVCRVQRSSDAWGRNMRKWYRDSQHAEWMREKKEDDAMHEQNMELSEGFMHALSKDVSTKPRAYMYSGRKRAA